MLGNASARWRGILVAALLLGSAGCSGGEPVLPLDPGAAPAGPTRSAAPRPAAPAPPPVNQADPVSVYRAWWAAAQQAFARGDADDPALARYAVDPVLGQARAQIRRLRAQGVVQRTRLAQRPRLVRQDALLAELVDCVRGPAGTYVDLATGRPRAPQGYRNDVPTRDSLRVSLHRRGGLWYVAAATNQGVQAC